MREEASDQLHREKVNQRWMNGNGPKRERIVRTGDTSLKVFLLENNYSSQENQEGYKHMHCSSSSTLRAVAELDEYKNLQTKALTWGP